MKLTHPKESVATAPQPRKTASPAGRASSASAANPLRHTIAVGKMPVILELHLTEGDRIGYQQLRRRYLSDGTALPNLTLLGQYLRQMDVTTGELSPKERDLTRKLQVYADLLNSGKIDLVALDDGARGRDALDNAVAAELLAGLGVDPSRLLANVVARNRQPDQLRRRIIHLAEIGLRNALLLTGDLPVDRSKPARFPLDSIGLCELVREMLVEGVLPEDFLIAAAGHPNPEADPDGMRTLHKALAGAKVIITQAVFSLEEFNRWMDALRACGVLDMVHVLASVIPISSSRQLRVLSEIPGIRVPGELLEEFTATEQRIVSTAEAAGHGKEWIEQRRRQEGVRITRTLLHRLRRVPGVSGFYLGCVSPFDAHLELLKETPLLPEQTQSLHKVAKLSGPERQRALAQLGVIEAFLDRMMKEARRRRHGLVRRTLRRIARARWVERVLKVIEWPKVPLFKCRKCDQCDLSPDALICPRGCAKQMSHGPCGAPRLVDGRVLCEDTTRECTWAKILARREQYGIPLAVRLETRPAPSPGFFEGRTYSAVKPLLMGTKQAPDWSLAWRAPLVQLARPFQDDYRLNARGSPLELSTLVESKSEQIRRMLSDRPDMDAEELLVKVLALVGTPHALHLIETRMADLGLPAEGCLADLSIREQFFVAEALPAIRRRATGAPSATSGGGRPARYDELLAVIPEGKALRQALRRERANRIIQHAASLGVRITYADVLLDGKNVEDFLQALTIIKDEIQVARPRLNLAPGRISVHCDRVHYKRHYRAPIALRRFNDHDGNPLRRVQLVVDVRQFESGEAFRSRLRDTIERLIHEHDESNGAIVLEDYAGESRSVCWAFNSTFWKRLREFEEATGVHYDASIGGSTDHNLAYVRSTARAYFDRIHERRASDRPLYVVEIGVASTHRARTFLDELRRISEIAGTDCYDRTTYVLSDRSEEILKRSTAELAQDHPNVEAVRMDAADPLRALAPYRGLVMHVHLCNVFDNLPTDKVAWVDGQLHRVEARLYVTGASIDALMSKHGFSVDDRPVLEGHLRGLRRHREEGVAELLEWARKRLTELGKPSLAYVGFWMDLFAALRLEERYVTFGGDGVRRTAERDLLCRIPGVGSLDEVLYRHISGQRDVQVHLNQQALTGFVQLLQVLNPHGTLEVVDLFVQRIEEYRDRFKGPAKYDGSTVNWLNGPLFRAVGERLGYEVRFTSFKPFDPKSSSVIMLASKSTP